MMIPKNRPTDAELAILNVLWDRGEASVREVYETLYKEQGGGYTTALKLLQVMHAKGLVERDESARAHRFRAALDKESTQRNLLADLVTRAFDGRPSQLVMRALGDAKVNDAELKAIRTLLEGLEGR
jgi:predicted transcriptional regulator